MALSLEKIVMELVEKQKMIVPIIGENMLYYQKMGSNVQLSLQEYIVDCFLEEYGKDISADQIKKMKEHGYYGLSLLYRKFNDDGNYADDFERYIKYAQQREEIRVKGSLVNFLRSFNFPLIITTTCFDFIECELNQYNANWYMIGGNNNIDIPTDRFTVYHIFGKANEKRCWVYNEDQLLRFMHSLHHGDYDAKGLAQYIGKEKRLLVLGCNMPDWIFRFLWYSIQGFPGKKERQGYWINNYKQEESLTDFLSDIYYASNIEVEQILINSTQKNNERLNMTFEIVNNSDCFDVFLSYASEDRIIAENIYDILDKAGIKVWFDNKGIGKIITGDNYVNCIKEGVAKSSHYMPIITENFINKMQCDSKLKTETNTISKHYNANCINNKRFSIPIIVKGRKYKDIEINNKYVDDVLAQSVLPKELFHEIKMVEYDSISECEFKEIDWKLFF